MINVYVDQVLVLVLPTDEESHNSKYLDNIYITNILLDEILVDIKLTQLCVCFQIIGSDFIVCFHIIIESRKEILI